MSSQTDTASKPQNERRSADRSWHWHPDLPLKNSPVFDWPPNPITIVKTLASYWFALTARVVIVVTALISWFYLQPALEQCVDFAPGWILQMYARNLSLILLVAGGMHLYFYTYTVQGKQLRFDARPLIRNGRAFSFRDQVKDNMFWSIASGVTLWTAYEVLLIWSFANGYISTLEWSGNQVWFVLVFVLIPIWYSFHFYWIHRSLHWPPLYRLVHSLHHRNINIGPWSGVSMHPIETLFYYSSVLIHFVVPSHPLHILFHLQFNTLAAVTSHSGFEALLVGGKKRMDLGYFFHQLHHRYFECNYGIDEMPWDKWFGSFHDGTPEATERVRERRRKMYGE
jgi:sterol desaturase/sphingolipid hydroxylase (fatty acid hydroxylase superfamily)